MRLPTRLKREPLIEAIWELRFVSNESAPAEVLLAKILAEHGSDLKRVEKLPPAMLPSEVRSAESQLRYAATIRMRGDQYICAVGERVVNLSCVRPYVGWTAYKSKIEALLDTIQNSGVISAAERFSLKYLDVINHATPPTLEWLNLKIDFGEGKITSEPMEIRWEVKREAFLNVVHVALPAEVRLLTGEKFSGMLLDVDTVFLAKDSATPDEFCDEVRRQLEPAHDLNKKLFFVDLLTQETIDAYEPEYE